MCALFGWLDCGKVLPRKFLKRFTQELANAAEERGTDASGISYVENGKIKIFKKPKPAHKMRFAFPEGTTAVMGHTRLTTQGNQKFNFNNHPFYGKADKEFAFAHNGVLYNDLTLRKAKEYSLSPSTKRGYEIIRDNRLKLIRNVKCKDLSKMQVQRAINADAARLSRKSLQSTLGLLKSVLNMFEINLSLKSISLPPAVKKEPQLPELYKIIKAIKGTDIELAVLVKILHLC